MTPTDWANEVMTILEGKCLSAGVIHTVYESMMDVTVDERGKALLELLKPITWPSYSDVYQRRRIVMDAHKLVYTVLPFLTKGEKSLAEDWLKREKHDGLWD